MIRPRLKPSDIKSGILVIHRTKPERGVYEVVSKVSKSHFEGKKFGGQFIIQCRTRCFNLATPEEVAAVVAARITGYPDLLFDDCGDLLLMAPKIELLI